MWPCTTSRTRGAAPRRGPRRAAGGRLKKTYMHLYTQNVRLTRSFYPLVDVVPAALECYAFCKETRTKWRSICIRHQDFSGTQGFRYSRCVAIPGLPGDYSYFAPASHWDFLSLSSCLRPASISGRGKRQQFQSNSQRK